MTQVARAKSRRSCERLFVRACRGGATGRKALGSLERKTSLRIPICEGLARDGLTLGVAVHLRKLHLLHEPLARLEEAVSGLPWGGAPTRPARSASLRSRKPEKPSRAGGGSGVVGSTTLFRLRIGRPEPGWAGRASPAAAAAGGSAALLACTGCCLTRRWAAHLARSSARRSASASRYSARSSRSIRFSSLAASGRAK